MLSIFAQNHCNVDDQHEQFIVSGANYMAHWMIDEANIGPCHNKCKFTIFNLDV